MPHPTLQKAAHSARRTLPRLLPRLGALCAAAGLLAAAASCHNDNPTTMPSTNPTAAEIKMPNHGMDVQVTEFGKMPDGQAVQMYTLNCLRLQAKVITYGATLAELHVPDPMGNDADVVLGFNDLAGYLNPKDPYFGATAGRVANRIAKGKFKIGDQEYTLAINNGPNSLHGGLKGFDKVVWKASKMLGEGSVGVHLQYTSKDMEEGYPGNLKVDVEYILTTAGHLVIKYTALTDKLTPVNITNHSYFNLAGAGNGLINDHILMINADKYTPVDDTMIPTGKLEPVKGTPLDFRKATPIGARIDQLTQTGGYDHNFCLNGADEQLSLCARVVDPKSGRVMEVYTDQPGVQLYTGNFLDGSVSGIGGAYPKHSAFCLETQHYPDSVNHASFPNTILKPGDELHSTTIYAFPKTSPPK